jgi:NAD+ synthase (glutamine-hydrolysing)
VPVVPFDFPLGETELTRVFPREPFLDREDGQCETILNIQAFGLKKRLAHAGSRAAVIGVSGGLDSALALVATVRAFTLAGLDFSDIHALTMPCFGTTELTKSNAYRLCQALGLAIREVDITDAVRLHFRDIGQSEAVRDAAYENAQARERTQVLMDLANRVNGLVIGTGDMSELALGWATYNGDHMSMYGVNGGIPKTLIRHVLAHVADTCGNPALSDVLRDIIATPVSPELLPAEDGQIAQKTEDLVGPYVLHDFFLFYAIGQGCGPRRLFAMARTAFAAEFDDATMLKWMRVFFRRFFAQQFKRSCLPDGPRVGILSLSPRGDLRMPSDAVWAVWQAELDELA